MENCVIQIILAEINGLSNDCRHKMLATMFIFLVIYEIQMLAQFPAVVQC